MRLSPVVQSLTEPLLSPLVSAITGVIGGGFNPRSLFADGSIGVLYDNNDFVEPTTWRRNLLTYSEQFDNAVWSKARLTVSADATTSPDGVLSADLIKEDATTNTRGVQQQAVILSGASYTASAYLKNIDRRYVSLIFVDFGTGLNGVLATFDLQSGTYTTQTRGTGVLIGAEITPVGNGWFRCAVTGSLSETSAVVIVSPNTQATPTQNTYGRESYLGDGVKSFYAWGAQLERGSTATTYQRITDFNSDFLAAFPNTTLFLDAAGTTAATVNGLVGLQLDKSQGLVLGSEIKSSGVIGIVGTATAATYNTSTGVGTVTRVDLANQSFVQWTFSGWAKVVIQNTGSTVLVVRSGSQAGTPWITLLGGESKEVIVRDTAGLITITSSANATTASFTVSSFKPLPGNHRYQTTTGSKPVLRGTPIGANLVTNGDFSNGTTGWSSINSATLSTVGGALRVTYNSSVNPGVIGGQAAVIGKVYRITLTISAISGGGEVNAYMGDVAIGAVTSAGTYVRYVTASGTSPFYVIAFGNTGYVDYDNIEVVDVSAGSVTAPYGLQYDGVDDFMQTASVNFSATDKMFVCAGVRKLSDAALSVLVESSASVFVNPGAFWIATPDSAAANIQFRAGGTTTGNFVRTGLASPISMVIIGTANISAPALGLRVNGSETLGIPVLGTGNFGNYPIYFGRRAGTSLPFNGIDFGFCIVGKTLTAAQIANTERWMAYRTGVTL